MTTKELTITEGAMPATFEELSGMAKAFVASGMFNDVKEISQGIVKIQAGKELGIPPVYAMQNINMIKGKLCTSANTMALLIKRSGHYNYRITEHTDTVCTIKFLELEASKWVEVGQSQFTIEDAKRAKLVYPDSAWIKYPRAMLFSRAISQGARLYTPDAIGGVYTSEEIKAIDGPVNDEPEPVRTSRPAETKKQAEEDSKEQFPEDPPNAEEAAKAAEEAAEQRKAEASEPTSPIDLDWLRESLGKLQGAKPKLEKWTNREVLAHINIKTGGEADKISDAVKLLSKEQAAELTAEIEETLAVL